MTYIIVDTANTFFRARHVVQGSADIKLGMAFHITLNSIKKAWNDFGGKDVVFCLEGRSWRKDFYKPYKANRQETRAAMTQREQDEDKLFWEAFDEFKKFVTEKTNCTILQHPRLEADDLIAGWTQAHPDAKHVIISTDGDFAQLIKHNVSQYNGVGDLHITHEGTYDAKGKPVKDKKTGEPKAAQDPEWMLFEKCMRGDTSDNVFSAYPGVRTNGAEHRVLEDYLRNVHLCDLTAQPDDIKACIKETITINAVPKMVDQVGIRMLKFCNAWDMKKIADNIQSYAEPFQAKYPTTKSAQHLFEEN